ncbi:MAG: flagellin [Deltaproteobacteria bacterium]|nr:flagellin [Deltaproteobacteria bacterium]
MGFRINTNIDAMTSHRNMLGTSGALSKSLERLSSGLRINRAADDASGMTIADSLRAQGSGLGQAMKNAGDAISLVQVADGALDESINIVNTIRTKAIQAASDGQNTVSRAAIQADVNKLLEEMNIIADTTAFNGQTLLKGNFINKSFQVGAYANQTVSVSIGNADASHVGSLATLSTAADIAGGGSLFQNQIALADLSTTANAAGYAQIAASTSATTGIKVNGLDMASYLSAQGSAQLSAKGIAAAINNTTTTTGVSATATTSQVGTTAVAATAVTAGTILINGVDIGAVTVLASDADGALATAINNKYADTGVRASVDSAGLMTLVAADGRNIQMTGANAVALGTGFATAPTTVVVVAGTAVAESATSSFKLDGTTITWSASSTLAATDDAALLAALNAAKTAGTVDADYTFTSDGAGNVTLSRADGLDVNISSATNMAAAQTIDGQTGVGPNNVVKNSAFHGVVSLTSAATINVTGDATTLQTLGFGNVNSAQAQLAGGIINADVTSARAAQVTIQRADSALTALDQVRSGLGSAQNQVEATLRNISVTRVNIQSAESAVRDVDFAEESSTFAKMNILVQAGSYALSQSNTVQQNIMTLLR